MLSSLIKYQLSNQANNSLEVSVSQTADDLVRLRYRYLHLKFDFDQYFFYQMFVFVLLG